MEFIHSISCPICNTSTCYKVLSSHDFSLTNDTFYVAQCANCSLRITFPIPSKEAIGKYYNFKEYISHSDTNKGFFNKIYHFVRKRTLLQKSIWVQSLFTGYKGNLLEVGAGTGAFANAMSLKGWNVTALEPDAASRRLAAEIHGLNVFPIENLYKLESNQFDVITLWHVLEHVHDVKAYLHQFHTLLKPNGRLIIAVPNYTSYDASFYKKYWAAYDLPRHLYHFSPVSMISLLQSTHFNLAQIKPMWYDSYYVSILSEKYKKTGLMGIVRALLIATISNLIAYKNNKRTSSLIYEIKK